MKRRVFISGTSGIGKTTLANRLSNLLDLPFMNGSGKVLWKDYNIRSHKQLIRMCYDNPQIALHYQYELLRYRHELMYKRDTFVTDRSIVDNIAYALMQLGPNISPKKLSSYFKRCENSLRDDDIFIILQLNENTISQGFSTEDDGKRINNIIYGKMMSKIITDVVLGNLSNLNIDPLNIIFIDDWDMSVRMGKTMEFLKLRWSL